MIRDFEKEERTAQKEQENVRKKIILRERD